ncbi:MAG: polysaccharide deacetylase family protein, partial [Ignavibacteriales bacterium]|nr:polysaccharide deacetylase family protein [Ignavibacteriales bacterium]
MTRIRSLLAGATLLCTLSFAQVNAPVPILCYHGFASDTSALQGKLTEKYGRFDKMLEFLIDHGYQTVFPEELEVEEVDIKKPVILTFDDGRKEQLRAAEMMNKRGMRGIFFIVPSRISSAGRSEFLTKEDLAILWELGHQIGVHGFSHRSMVESPEETEAVRTQSLPVIQEAIHMQRVFPSFAYPFGHYDTSVVQVVSEFYRYLHTVNPGYWDGRSKHIPRTLITNDRPEEFFQEYILKSSEYQPSLSSLLKDGSQANVVPFRVIKPVT